jgi:hypothetical protein
MWVMAAYSKVPRLLYSLLLAKYPSPLNAAVHLGVHDFPLSSLLPTSMAM